MAIHFPGTGGGHYSLSGSQHPQQSTWTIMLRVRFTSLTLNDTAQRLVWINGTADLADAYAVGVVEGNQLSFGYQIDDLFTYEVETDRNYHIAVVSESGVASRVYIDGELVYTGAAVPFTPEYLAIGGANLGGDWQMHGAFACVRYYNSALSQERIRQEMLSPTPVSTVDIHDSWRFDYYNDTSYPGDVNTNTFDNQSGGETLIPNDLDLAEGIIEGDWVIGAIDTFDRADTSSLGDPWEIIQGDGLAIISGEVASASTSGVTAVVWSDSNYAFGPKQFAEAEIRSPGPFDLPGVVVRGNAGGTYYTGYYRPETGLVFIAKFVGGAISNLQSAVGVVTNGSVMRLEVETIGSSVSLTLYINGVQVVSAIDSSSPILTGQPGLLYSWNNFRATRIDNFRAGTFREGGEEPDGQSITVSSISTAELFGAAALANVAARPITLSGIISDEAFGALAITNVAARTLVPSSIETAETFGEATVADVVLAIVATGIETAEAFGSHALAGDTESFVLASGITSLEAFGDPVIQGLVAQAVVPSSISTAEVFGEPELAMLLQGIEVSSIASAEAFGDATLAVLIQTIAPNGIPSMAAFGITRFEGGIIVEADEGTFVVLTQPLFRPLWVPVIKE